MPKLTSIRFLQPETGEASYDARIRALNKISVGIIVPRGVREALNLKVGQRLRVKIDAAPSDSD